MARSIHSYPSHGYLLHRISLALATSNVFGLLSACGVVGKLLGCLGRLSWRVSLAIKPQNILRKRRQKEWEAEGSKRAILLGSNGGAVQNGDLDDDKVRLLSYLEACSDKGHALNDDDASLVNRGATQIPFLLDVVHWNQSKPE